MTRPLLPECLMRRIRCLWSPRFVLPGLLLLVYGCAVGPPLPDDARLLSNVGYAERASGRLVGRLFLPAGKGPNPAVLLLHGGGWRNGSPQQMDVIARRLVGEGFVVFSAAYRLAPETRYPGQLQDARAALAWLADRPEVDPTRIATWGYSAGAQLALLLGLRTEPGQPRPSAIVAGGAPAALGLFDARSRLLVNYLGAPREDAPGIWAEASPVEWVSQDDPPAYLYHGRADALVDIQHARLLAGRLRASDVEVILDEVPGGHVSVFLTGRDIEARATAFLTRLLGGTGQTKSQGMHPHGMLGQMPGHGAYGHGHHGSHGYMPKHGCGMSKGQRRS